MKKDITLNQEAQEAVITGVNKLADVVKTTLGPVGKTVIIQKPQGGVTVTKDGVTVAKEVIIADDKENSGAELIKEVASKTNDNVGDGTTTATVLAQALIKHGKGKTQNTVLLNKNLHKFSEMIIDELKNNISRKVVSGDDIEKVASISANDPEIGKKIADAIEKVGHNGIINVQESNGFETEVDVVRGMRINKGFVSPYMVTDPNTHSAKYRDVPVLLVEGNINTTNEVVGFLQKVMGDKRKNVVIIADDFDPSVVSTAILNKVNGVMNILLLKTPEYGDAKKHVLGDIAVLTGATIISPDNGVTLETAELSHCGMIGEVVSTKEHTTFIGSKVPQEQIDNRIHELNVQKDSTNSNFEKRKLKERMAKLSGGIGIIKVGASTETEMTEIKHRVEDAIGATQAAIEEGIVPGGGVALYLASLVLDGFDVILKEEVDAKEILKKACLAPLFTICENSGLDGETVLQGTEKGTFGYDAVTGEIVDSFGAGIVDPTKVTRTALQNAVSIAGMVLNTQALITIAPPKQ